MLDGYGAVQVLRKGECHGKSVLFTAPSKVMQNSFAHCAAAGLPAVVAHICLGVGRLCSHV